MNYLSHFYFDRFNPNEYEILGCLLPDLVKSCQRNWNLYPEKLSINVYTSLPEVALLSGWKKHLLIDKIFHSSAYFKYHQQNLRIEIAKIMQGSEVKPFFLSHISFELLLDHLLVTNKMINAELLYAKITLADKQHISNFLVINKLENLPYFFTYFDKFCKEKFLLTYDEIDKIVYALSNVCRKIWRNPFTNMQQIQLAICLNDYKNILAQDFIIIFDIISQKLDINQ